MQTFRDIDSILRRIGDHFRRQWMVESGAWCFAAFAFLLGVAVVLAQVGWVRLAAGCVTAAAVGAVGTWVWLVRMRSTPMLAPFGLARARLVEELAPEIGSSPSSAVDLERQIRERKSDDDVSFSKELVEAHLERTVEQLGQVDLDSRLDNANRRRRLYGLLAVGGTVLWALALTLWLDGGRARLAMLLLDPGAARMSDVPLAGDIRITYSYPAYTGLDNRIVEGGDGSISAVAGTEVTIEAISDVPTDEAFIILQGLTDDARREIPLEVDGERSLKGSMSILHDGKYRFALLDGSGDRLEERGTHPVRSLVDNYPEVHLDQPATDVELKDDQKIDVLWRARDDYGISEVNLVVEPDGAEKPIRLPLSTPEEADKRREGRYRWAVLELGLEAGTEASFYVEAVDNDTVGGPKKATSATRRLVLFSARKNHEGLLEKQREFMDKLVDWLAKDLENPFPRQPTSNLTGALEMQGGIITEMATIESFATSLIAELREDKLTKPEIAATFSNIAEHVAEARVKRSRVRERATKPGVTASILAGVVAEQSRAVKQLERDIIYLDDLLAVQRIDELKDTAKDLLAAQRDLQELLQKYKETQDPELKAALEQQIRELRNRMMELLARMSQIKEQLPGEYRNMEAASMMQLDDQMDRLEKMLKEGDLDSAAKELEQLANRIEDMMNRIDRAEEEYGGERYAEVRKQLNDFANEFQQLENQQEALAKRSEELLKEYRRRAVQQAGRDMDRFVEKARAETAKALKELDGVASAPGLWGRTQRELDNARQKLLDLDALLEHRDFAEAREVARSARAHGNELVNQLKGTLSRFRQPPTREMSKATRAGERANDHTEEVADMLDKLFPDPSDVLRPEQVAQMRRMQGKQRELQQKAQQLGQRMDELSEQLPLFGGQPRASLQQAQGEMGQAVGAMGQRQLPRAAGHKRRASEQLKSIRESLEQASQQGGQGGLPLPLGQSSRGGRGQPGGPGNRNEDVAIPPTDPNRAGPKFRKDLLEAAKQKPPARYEDAVRRYYEELIR